MRLPGIMGGVAQAAKIDAECASFIAGAHRVSAGRLPRMKLKFLIVIGVSAPVLASTA